MVRNLLLTRWTASGRAVAIEREKILIDENTVNGGNFDG